MGRKKYLDLFDSLWSPAVARIIAVYGRRRVGKTALIQRFAAGKKAFLFEAVEGEDTPAQVRHFLEQLAAFAGKPHLKDLAYKDWPPVFDLFTEIIFQEKSLIVCFDEISWMAAGRSRLISYIKYYWDNKWKQHPHLLFILCGSVASWMVKNVVKATALYGRIGEHILVEQLKPGEISEFIGAKRGAAEVLEYCLCFGGIPRYLEEFDFNKSIQLNIERTCFQPSGFFTEEADKIFYSQFKETGIYKKIVARLLERPLSLQEISKKIRISSGGGLKLYLDNLMAAGIVDKNTVVKDFKLIKNPRYFVADEFLHFHRLFIRPNLAEIRLSSRPSKFLKFTQNRWDSFLGLAFERFCLRNRYEIAELLGFGEKVLGCGSVSGKGLDGFQFDLAYIRRDRVISLCEVKYLSEPPSTKLIREFETKLARASFPTGATIEKALISNRRPSQPLIDSGYFHQILSADEIVSYTG